MFRGLQQSSQKPGPPPMTRSSAEQPRLALADLAESYLSRSPTSWRRGLTARAPGNNGLFFSLLAPKGKGHRLCTRSGSARKHLAPAHVGPEPFLYEAKSCCRKVGAGQRPLPQQSVGSGTHPRAAEPGMQPRTCRGQDCPADDCEGRCRCQKSRYGRRWYFESVNAANALSG